jgi:glycosyltransferase involved in cell wall biosynthesis
MKKLAILGTRGVPAAHGGFETFAEKLSLYLVEKGWEVTVYCQEEGNGPVFSDAWEGVRRIRIPVSRGGAAGTVIFDWKATWHAASRHGLTLTLGYNTALFCALLRLRGVTNLINMDGIEWRRDKWSTAERAWLYLNERAGCLLGNHLIADHPEIEKHLRTRVFAHKITMIPYGAEEIIAADEGLLRGLGLTPDGFALVVARPEPENSILEIVRAFSVRKRDIRLVVLGDLKPRENVYHRALLEAAGDEVMFPGAIYDKAMLAALRFHARLYIHGHTVGGTNPSLVEALGAGSPVLAHDNGYNRWVAGQGAAYFLNQASCADKLDALLNDEARIREMSAWSRHRFHAAFRWDHVLQSYERLLLEKAASR